MFLLYSCMHARAHTHVHTHTQIQTCTLTNRYTVVPDTGFQKVFLTFNEANSSDQSELFSKTGNYLDIVHTCQVPVTSQWLTKTVCAASDWLSLFVPTESAGDQQQRQEWAGETDAPGAECEAGGGEQLPGGAGEGEGRHRPTPRQSRGWHAQELWELTTSPGGQSRSKLASCRRLAVINIFKRLLV